MLMPSISDPLTVMNSERSQEGECSSLVIQTAQNNRFPNPENQQKKEQQKI